MNISLDFKVRDARETLEFLRGIPRGGEQPFERQVQDALTDALANRKSQTQGVNHVTLWKTTIVIWSDRDPIGYELVDLAQDATDGNSKCSKCKIELVDKPEADPDFAGIGDFFGTEETEAPQGETLESPPHYVDRMQ